MTTDRGVRSVARCRTCRRLLRGRDWELARVLAVVGVRPYCRRCRRGYEADHVSLTHAVEGFDRPCRLRTLLAGVTSANRHEEVDWGPPVGREVG